MDVNINTWIIKDRIKRGLVTYIKNDIVVLYRRKGKYPAAIKDDINYTVQSVEKDFILVSVHSTDGRGWMQPIKVHKTYMIHKSSIRDIKIDILLR
jgi:2,3-bisphosphoglycerate-independent phosphoglycerate mutase